MKKTVIAVLDVNEKGAVTAVNKTTDSMTRMEKQTTQVARKMKTESTKSASAVTKNLKSMTVAAFSLSTAAVALVGAFTLGGIVRMTKEFVGEIVKADERWENVKWSAMAVKEELQAIVRDLPVFDELLDKAESITLLIGATLQMLSTQKGLLQLLKLGASAFFFEFKGVADVALDIQDRMAEIKRRADELKKSAGEFRWIMESALLMLTQIGKMPKAGEGYFGPVESWVDDVKAIGEITEESIGYPQEMIDQLTMQFNLLSVAATAAGAAISQALFSASMSGKQAVANLLKTIATIAIANMLASIAAAVSATTGLGVAITGGTKEQHVAAAKFWGKVAAFSAAGAIAFGARETTAGGGGGGGIGVGMQAPQAPSRVQPNVTIYVEGSLMGTNKDQLAREITDLVRRGQADQG